MCLKQRYKITKQIYNSQVILKYWYFIFFHSYWNCSWVSCRRTGTGVFRVLHLLLLHITELGYVLAPQPFLALLSTTGSQQSEQQIRHRVVRQLFAKYKWLLSHLDLNKCLISPVFLYIDVYHAPLFRGHLLWVFNVQSSPGNSWQI